MSLGNLQEYVLLFILLIGINFAWWLSDLIGCWVTCLFLLCTQKCMVQMLLLAGPGVMISTFCLGSLLKVSLTLVLRKCFSNLWLKFQEHTLQLTFPYNWSWKTSLLLGGLLSATDPVAVVALLKQLGASKKLSTIIEGESLMNDGYVFSRFDKYSFLWKLWTLLGTRYTPLKEIVTVSRTAIVVYQLFYKMVLGQSFNWIAIVKFLSQVSLGA